MRRNHTQRGAMLPIVLGAILVLSSLAYGGFTLLRVVVARQEAQRAADAAVLVAANIIKHEGLPFDAAKQGKAQEVALKNSGLPLEFRWDPVQESPEKVDIIVHVAAKVSAPAFIFTSGSIEVIGTATGSAAQTTIAEAQKKYPKLVLVLDFSGSMLRKLGTAQGPDGYGVWTDDKNDPSNSYQRLLAAVDMLLALNYEIKYGLVAYAGSVISNATVPIALGNKDTIYDHVHADYGCPGGSNCTTNTGGGLARATALFNDSPGDEGRYILLVSDGQPDAEGPAIQEANKLWNLPSGIVTIFTLHLINFPTGTTALRTFMLKLSGQPGEGETAEDYYASADSDEAIMKQFKRIGAALACQIGPLDPVPPNPDKMHVFIKAGSGYEDVLINSRKVQPPAKKVGDLWNDELPFAQGLYYFYKPETATLFVTPQVCERVQTNHEPIIVRYKGPKLSD